MYQQLLSTTPSAQAQVLTLSSALPMLLTVLMVFHWTLWVFTSRIRNFSAISATGWECPFTNPQKGCLLCSRLCLEVGIQWKLVVLSLNLKICGSKVYSTHNRHIRRVGREINHHFLFSWKGHSTERVIWRPICLYRAAYSPHCCHLMEEECHPLAVPSANSSHLWGQIHLTDFVICFFSLFYCFYFILLVIFCVQKN